MKTLTLFHDPECPLCARFLRWLVTQESDLSFRAIPYHSEQARKCFPLIDSLQADENIVVLADDGRWWQGPAAWVTCLWALKEYREWSFRLATPALSPLVSRACHLLSENRLQVSRLLRLEGPQLAGALGEVSLGCDAGGCRPKGNQPGSEPEQIGADDEHPDQSTAPAKG